MKIKMKSLMALVLAVAMIVAAVYTGVALAAQDDSNVCASFQNQDSHETNITCATPTSTEIDTLKASEFYQQANATYGLDLTRAAVMTKADVAFRILAVPVKVQRGTKALDQLYVYLDDSGAIQKAAMFHTHTNDDGTMEISFRDGNGAILTGAIFNKGEMVKDLTPDEDPSASFNWNCWSRCMRSRWNSMPGELKWLCEGAYAGCIFGGQLWACPGCAFCVGFWAGFCNRQCP